MSSIVLIGPPGSGKSTIGAALAKQLSWPFVDTDQIVSSKAGKSVSDIFVEEGEQVFRAAEFEVLKEVLLLDEAVISLGGGAPISRDAQSALLASGSLIVFLDISLATAAPRIGFNRDRPLLLGNPRAQWQALSDARRPIYETLATLKIKVDDLNVEQIVQSIESSLQ